MRSAKSRPALAADRINFVNEHDARRAFFCFRKQVTNARRADADEHLHEFRSADVKEWDIGFAGHGA